jgi:hypothetical protein
MSDELNQALSTQSAVRVLRAAFYAPGIDGRAGLPLMLLGDPGVGKSAMVRQFARGLRDKNGNSIACEVLSPGERGDGAFGVTPVPVERGGRHVLVYPVPEWAEPLLAPDAVGLVFVDEIQEAPPHIRAALLGLIHDRRIGGAQLGPNVRVIAAGNDPTTVQSGYGLAANAANRMGHLNWPQPTLAEHGAYMSSLVSAAGGSAAESFERVDEVEALVQKAWPREFARAVGLEFSFHRSNGGARKNMFPGKRGGEAERLRLDPSGAWPSDRSWDLATRALAMSTVLELTPAERTAFVGSFISAPVAAEWLGFIGGTDLPDPVEFLAGKAEFKHSSKRLDRSWALVSACINTLRVKEYATGDNAVTLYRFIGEQLINADMELAQWAWEQMVNPQTGPRNPKTSRMFFLSDLGVSLRYKDRNGVEKSLMAILGEACAGTK